MGKFNDLSLYEKIRALLQCPLKALSIEEYENIIRECQYRINLRKKHG